MEAAAGQMLINKTDFAGKGIFAFWEKNTLIKLSDVVNMGPG